MTGVGGLLILLRRLGLARSACGLAFLLTLSGPPPPSPSLALQPAQMPMGSSKPSGSPELESPPDEASQLRERAAAVLAKRQALQKALKLEADGDKKGAIAAYRQALDLFDEEADASDRGAILNSMGTLHFGLGDFEAADRLYRQSLALRRQTGSPQGEARTLSNIAMLRYEQALYADAIDHYQQSKSILASLSEPEPLEIASVENKLGLVYAALGQADQAREHYRSALELRRDRDRDGFATTLHNIAFLHQRQGENRQAQELYREALAIRRQVGDRLGEAETLNNLGYLYAATGKPAEGLPLLREAATTFESLGNTVGLANTLDSIGKAHEVLGQYQDALQFYFLALAKARAVGLSAAELEILSNIGSVMEAEQRPEVAIVFYKQSVNVTEKIRTGLRRLQREQQASYAREISDTYRRLADLLLRQERLPEAQAVLDLLKIQELDDFLHIVRSSEAASDGVDLTDEEQRLEQLIVDLLVLHDLLRSGADDARYDELIEKSDALMDDFHQFIESPEVRDLMSERSTEASGETVDPAQLQTIRKRLPPHAVALYPIVLEDRMEVLLTTKFGGPFRHSVDVSRDVLDREILNLRSALADRSGDASRHAQTLYGWLIERFEPVFAELETTHIVYIPDGQLRYVPLGALQDRQGRWLAERFAINYVSALGLTNFAQAPPSGPMRVLAGAFGATDRVVVVGDKSWPFTGLPGANAEIENLADLVPEMTRLADMAFSARSVRRYANQHSVVHLATHAEFLPGSPMNSFIVFGDGGVLRLEELKGWSLTDVEMMVLSSCETAVGGGSGVEILGFGWLMQKSGAAASVASLWKVDDGGTQALMNAFYRHLQDRDIGKAEALQRAQIELIESDPQVLADLDRGAMRLSEQETDHHIVDRLKHPYYWAPFILIGNGL